MSSGFISEAEIAANKQKRQEEWEKVRQPDEPLEVEEAPYDSRSLYDKLKEQKDKKDYEYEEAHKLKNLIRGLDDDEVDFLHVIDKAKATADHQQHMEAEAELREYREQVASLQAKDQEKKLQAEIAKAKVQPKLSTRPSQKNILAGMVRKRPATSDSGASSSSSAQPKTAATSSTASNKDTSSSTVTSSEAPSSSEQQPSSATSSVETKTLKVPSTPATVGQRCIGVLPGVGRYHSSSDSDKSTDTDDDYDYSNYNWLGQPIKRSKCGEGGGNCGHEH